MAGNKLGWSTTPANNANADSTINWLEGQANDTFNNSFRAQMAVEAANLADNNATLTTGGSANAYTVTSNQTMPALATGLKLRLKINASNTGASTLTLTPNGGSAFVVKAINTVGAGGERALNANELRANGIYDFNYDAAANSAAGAFILLNPSPSHGAGAASQFNPSNPGVLASVGGLMAGLGSTCTLTPVFSTRALVTFSGLLANSAGGGAAITIRYGTGTAPSNGAALTGTVVGNTLGFAEYSAGAAVPVGHAAIATGLTVGTAYWFDLALQNSGAGNATVANISCTVTEI